MSDGKTDRAADRHLIGEFIGNAGGPTLVAVGSLHGNEPAGLRAVQRVAEQLGPMREKIRGRIYLLAGNTRAIAAKTRFLESDLNRHWTRDALRRIDAGVRYGPEDEELAELVDRFDEILSSAREEVYVLDLHSTSASGNTFATVGDTMRNRHFAQKFPITIMLGIEEQLDGTMLEYVNGAGAVTLGFEGGQHRSDSAAANHEALVWLGLVNAGILLPEDVPDLDMHRRTLSISTGKRRIIEVRHREPIGPDDKFEMRPGFANFDPVGRGEVLAKKNGRQVRSPESGLIMMPLYQSKGDDGFFICRDVRPFWLWLSEVLRSINLGAWMYLLPGISRHPVEPESLIVNTRVARLFPLQIFHLLGFRKRRWAEHRLVVSRRRHDTAGPFTAKRA